MKNILPLILCLMAIACDSTDKISVDDGLNDVDQNDRDADGDGFYASEDCNDNLANTYPGALEVCDGVDNNCDGEIDEGVAGLYYQDNDGDGFGSPESPIESCDIPTGYVPSSTDCDDSNATVFPGAEEICDDLDNDCDGEIDDSDMGPWYPDMDNDGFGVLEGAIEGCDPPEGYVPTYGDCDDQDSTVNPLSTEECDGIDNNCNGQIDDGIGITIYRDADGDGFGNPNDSMGSCVLVNGYVSDNSDCDDTDPSIHPNTLWYLDYDMDGFGDGNYPTTSCIQPNSHVLNGGDCLDTDPQIHPNAVDVCDGLDNDCSGLIDDGLNPGQYWYVDVDNDGYGDDATAIYSCQAVPNTIAMGGDCDDSDASLNPDATEVCDGIDNDCDTFIDDDDSNVDVSTGIEFYIDLDEDGHGDANSPFMACSLSIGLSELDNDCNDIDPFISPSVGEVCDQIDNNCDGLVDEADPNLLPTTWYIDNDLDGYGIDLNTVVYTDCSVPAGYANLSGDCDDDNELLSPGMTEICHDELDNDCDNESDCNDVDCDFEDICFQPWEICTDQLDNAVSGTAGFNYLGAKSSGLGDVNGDGFADFAVTAYGNSENGSGAGKIYIFYGGSFNDSTTLADANCTLVGESAFDNAGWDISGGGDVDGDGKSDIIISSPSHDSTASDSGTVYLFYGSQLSGFCEYDMSDAAHRFEGENAGDKAGESVAFIGDIDGDSRSDLAIGAPNSDSAGSNAGKVYILLGADVIQQTVHSLSDSHLIIRGADSGDNFGWSITGGGDVNGDFIPDMVVGAPGELNSTLSPGRVHYFSGASLNSLTAGTISSASQADLTLSGQNNADRAGYAVSLIYDADNDGNHDIVVSAVENDMGGQNAGVVYLVHSSSLMQNPSLMLHTTPQKFIGEFPEDYAGYDLSVQSDTDGDGLQELWIGAYGNNVNGNSSGRVYQMTSGRFAARTVSMNEASLIFSGVNAYDWFGRSVSAVGDVNGDGMADIVIGAPNNSDYGSYSGKFYFANFPLGQSNNTVQFTASIYPSDNSNVLRCQPEGCVAEPLEGFVAWTNDSDGDTISNDAVVILNDDNVHFLDPITCQLNLYDADFNEHTSTYTFNTTALLTQQKWVGNTPQDKVGISIAGTGDFDGDGIHDLLIGGPGSQTASGQTGSVFLLQSSTASFSSPSLSAALIFEGEISNDKLGRAVSFVGDITDDGFDDILIGAPGRDSNRGFAYFVPGYDTYANMPISTAADVVIEGEYPGDLFGRTVSVVGDRDLDLIGDLGVGAPGFDGAHNDIGRVYLFSSAVSTGASTISSSNAMQTIDGVGPQEKLGTVLASQGDINGDGLIDFGIGSPHFSKTYLFYGGGPFSSSLDATDCDAMIYDFNVGSEFGASLSFSSDINNDGYDDVLIGAPSDGLGSIQSQAYGAAYVFSGDTVSQNANLTNMQANITIESEQVNSKFGSHVVLLQDLDGGGSDDIGIGAPGFDGVLRNAGRISLFYTEAFGFSGVYLSSDAERVRDGEWSGAEIGNQIQPAIDLGQMGNDGVLFGVWQHVQSPHLPGAVFFVSEF